MEFTVFDFLSIIRKRIWIIILITAFTAIFSYARGFVLPNPVYQADTTLYIAPDVNLKEETYNKDTLMSESWVNDCRELVKSRLVANEIIKQLSLTNISPKDILHMIDVNSKDNTRVIQITVQNENPELARDIANKAAEIFIPKAKELMGIIKIQVIDEAVNPTESMMTGSIKKVFLAAFLACVLSTIVTFLIGYMGIVTKNLNKIK